MNIEGGNLMILLKGFFVTLALVLAGTTVQEQEKEVVIMSSDGGTARCRVELRIEDDGAENMSVDINGATLELDPSEIAEGETRTYTLDDGTELTVLRTSDALVLNVNDKEIRVPLAHGEGDDHVWITADGDEIDLEEIPYNNTVTISGLGDLDEETRTRIIQALRGAGVEKEIEFSDHTVISLHKGASFITSGDENGSPNVKVIKHGKTHQKKKVKVIKIH
jgi:hypothetical protein